MFPSLKRAALTVAAAAFCIASAACAPTGATDPPTVTLTPSTKMPACAAKSAGCTTDQMKEYTAAAYGQIRPFFTKHFPQLKAPELVYIPAGVKAETKCKETVLVVFAVSEKFDANEFAACQGKIYVGQYGAYEAYSAGPLVPALSFTNITSMLAITHIKSLMKTSSYELYGPMTQLSRCVTGVWFQDAVKRHLPGAKDEAVMAYLNLAYSEAVPEPLAKYRPPKAVAAEAIAYGRQHTIEECNQHYLPKYQLADAK